MRFRIPRWIGGCVCAWLALVVGGRSEAATIVVPAGGDFQAALNSAQPGDVITLAAGATYTGNFVLPNKGAIAQPIVVRTSADDSLLPPAGVRVTPAYAALLPKIKSPNSVSALRTAAAANHWTLMFLEFQANQNGYGDIVELGAGDSTQTSLAQVPYSLVVDRVYVHGDPVLGQKRGIALNSSDTTIVNSYIADCKAVGQEAQAMSGFNGPGNYLIENNYLEGSTQSFLLGGADPMIANLVTTNVTVRRNYMTKQLAWMNPIVATPVNVTAAAATGSGTLAAGTYGYKIVARMPAGQTTKATSAPSVEVTATLAAAGGVALSWTPVAGASDYLVFGRTAGAENMSWTTTNAFFTDAGTAGTAGTPGSATKWYVKNVFELKNAQDVLVEGNVIENLWVAAQQGYPVVFTPRNQGGTAPWVVVQRVTFQHNTVRHTAGGVNILGTDNLAPSQLTNHIVVRDNLLEDLTAATWGSGSKVFELGDGPDTVTIDHNTVVTTDNNIVWLYGGTSTAPTPITNAVYTNNMSMHNAYGIMGSNFSYGLSSINAYMPGAVVTANVLAGGSASKYPAGNYFPTAATWQAQFVNYAGGDYTLAATSPYRGVATDGGDLGANVALVNAEAANATSGDDRTDPTGSSQVQITTTALPDGMLNTPYAQTLTCSGGSQPCQWQVQSGVLPQGLAFDSVAAVVSGTPTAVQTGSITVEAFDPSAPSNYAIATLTVTVDAPPVVVTMPTPPAGQVGLGYGLQPAVSGIVGTASWSIASGALPPGISLNPATGAIAGTPTAWGTATAMVQAQDSWGTNRASAQPATITIAPAALAIATSSLPDATYQSSYLVALATTGGTGSTNWSLVSGALPPGIVLGQSGVLSGTPTSAGVYGFTVLAADANWPSYQVSAALTLTVDAPTFTVSIASNASGQVGVAFSTQATATGQLGSPIWSIASGTLPPGVAIDSSSGLVSGTPTSWGTFGAVVQAVDSANATRIATAPLTVSVAPAPINVSTTSLPSGSVKRAYSATLTATGGTGSTAWSVVSGSLPPGLTMTSSGRISGTPTAVGKFTFTVQALDTGWSGDAATATLTINIVRKGG